MKKLFYPQTHNTHHTPRLFLWLENIVISNYNEHKLLIFTQKNRKAFERARVQKLVFLWLSFYLFIFNMWLWVKAYSLLFFDYNTTVLFFDYYYSRT